MPLPENKDVVVIGGGTVGCETGLLLNEKGNNITILEMLGQIAIGMEMSNKLDLMQEMKTYCINNIVNAKVEKICPDKVVYVKDSQKHTIKADYIVLSIGQRSVGRELLEELKKEEIPYTVIVDAVKPGKFVTATTSGFFAALNA